MSRSRVSVMADATQRTTVRGLECRRRGVGDGRRATTAAGQACPTRTGPAFAQPAQNHRSAALFQRYRATRDRALRDEIVTRHLALARHVARRFDTSRVAFDDLVQVASIGLIKAVDRYDPAYGTTFATFAVPTIRGEILRYFRDHTWGVRPPRNLQERALELVRASDEMIGEAGQRPSAADLAERVGATVDDVLEGLYAAGARDGVSMERPADDDDDAAAPRHARRRGWRVRPCGRRRDRPAADDAAHRARAARPASPLPSGPHAVGRRAFCSIPTRCRSPGSSAARWPSSPRQQRALPVSTPGASDTHSRTLPRPSRRP